MLTRTKPEVEPKALYGMSDTARILEVNRSTVDRYIDSLGIQCLIRKANKRRYLTGRQIQRIWEDVYLYKRNVI